MSFSYNLCLENGEEKKCAICDEIMIPGKDVASLVEISTGSIPCRSFLNRKRRENQGETSLHHAVAFQDIPGKPMILELHVFHTSYLIHWILWCSEAAEIEKPNDIDVVFCPKCRVSTQYYPESQMSIVKAKILKGHKDWTKSREKDLQNCSIGFHFPQTEDIVKEEVMAIKSLQFYHAEHQSVEDNDLPSDDHESQSGNYQIDDHQYIRFTFTLHFQELCVAV